MQSRGMYRQGGRKPGACVRVAQQPGTHHRAPSNTYTTHSPIFFMPIPQHEVLGSQSTVSISKQCLIRGMPPGSGDMGLLEA